MAAKKHKRRKREQRDDSLCFLADEDCRLIMAAFMRQAAASGGKPC
jgi:hypothetical protein